MLPSRGCTRVAPSLDDDRAARPRIAVLIPARNEESILPQTLATLMPQIQGRDRVVVVADNCNDSTAAIARAHRAVVVEREDIARRGKGFALDHGMRFLEQDPPAIVIMIEPTARSIRRDRRAGGAGGGDGAGRRRRAI